MNAPQYRQWSERYGIPDMTMISDAIKGAKIARGGGSFENLSLPAGEARTIADSNPERIYLFILNTGTTNLRLQFNAKATDGVGIPLEVGGYYENPAHFVPSGLVSVYCEPTGDGSIAFMIY